MMMTIAYIVYSLLANAFSMAIVAMVRENGEGGSFHWDENQKQNVLGMALWGEAFGRIVNGRISEVVGPRRMVAYATLLSGLVTLLTPLFAVWNYYVLLVSRIVLGILLGSLIPCIFPLTAAWFHPEGRSKFLLSLEGIFLGVAISNFVGGLIIAKYGWAWVFYILGTIGMFWSIIWLFMVYDSPQQHPRISTKEKIMIVNQLGADSNRVKTKFTQIPWIKILLSGPVWVIVIVQVVSTFVNRTLSNQLPSYMDQVMKFKIEKIGVFSSLPFLGKYLVAVVIAQVTDHLMKSQKYSTEVIRKSIETVGLLLPSFCMVLVALLGENSTVALIAFFPMIILNAASIGGHLANILDITSNYSGTISGIAMGLSMVVSYFSFTVVANLLQNGNTFEQWRYLFWILFGINTTGWVIFVWFASSKPQSWDVIEDKTSPPQQVT